MSVKNIRELINVCGLNIEEPLHTEVLNVINKALDKYEQQEWIPCSERLPEEETDVLVQWGEHSDMSVARIRKEKWHIHGIFLQEIGNPEVIIAWMPLPEPYKEGGGSDEA